MQGTRCQTEAPKERSVRSHKTLPIIVKQWGGARDFYGCKGYRFLLCKTFGRSCTRQALLHLTHGQFTTDRSLLVRAGLFIGAASFACSNERVRARERSTDTFPNADKNIVDVR